MVRTKETVLRKFGLFREFGRPDDESMLPWLRGANYPPEVLEYLRQGSLFIASPGPVHDVLDNSCGLVGTASILTDGVWAWRNDTVHYVECHGLALPEEFLSHMRSNGFAVPELTRDRLRALRL